MKHLQYAGDITFLCIYKIHVISRWTFRFSAWLQLLHFDNIINDTYVRRYGKLAQDPAILNLNYLNKEAYIFLLFLIFPDSIPISLMYFIQFYTVPILLYNFYTISYQFYTLCSIFNWICKFINAIFPMQYTGRATILTTAFISWINITLNTTEVLHAVSHLEWHAIEWIRAPVRFLDTTVNWQK